MTLNESDHAAVVGFCRERSIGLVVVGPEAPLVDGLADALAAAGVPVFGPSKSAARLEGSKAFMKDLCAKYKNPDRGVRQVHGRGEGEGVHQSPRARPSSSRRMA